MKYKFSSGKYTISQEHLGGYCICPGKYDGEIHIDTWVKKKKKLNYTIHEALHAEFPEMSEKKVNRLANRLGGFLWLLGYRQKKRKNNK